MNKLLLMAGACALLGLGFVLGRMAPSGAAAAAPETAPPAFMIVLGKGYDRERLRPYAQALPPLYAEHGGAYLAITRDVEVLEGSFPYDSVTVARWPSMAAGRAFWNSPEYAEARKLREGNGTFDVFLFEGLPARSTTGPLANESPGD